MSPCNSPYLRFTFANKTFCTAIANCCRYLYERFYGDGGGLPTFRPSVGLLLRDDLHHAFDRLMLPFYQKVSN